MIDIKWSGKIIIMLIIVILFSVFTASCKVKDTAVNGAERYYYNGTISSAAANEAFVYDLSDGSLIVACPDPLCPHTPDQENCPFAGSYTDYIAVTGKYIYYILRGKKGGETGSVYIYDISENKTKKIYEFEADYDESAAHDFLAGDGKLYFNAPEIKTLNGVTVISKERRIMCYDPQTDKVTEFGRPEENDFIRCVSNGSPVFQRGVYYRAEGGFDNCEKILPPEGEQIGQYGYTISIEPGVMAKCYYPQSIYLYETGRRVEMPDLGENSLIYTPVKSGDNVYYQLSMYRTEKTETENGVFYGLTPYSTEPDENGEYTATVYITDKNGATEKYVIKSKYSFIMKKAYEHCIFCDLQGICENGRVISPDETTGDTIWIDLDTGKAILYNSGASRVFNVVLGETTVKAAESKP